MSVTHNHFQAPLGLDGIKKWRKKHILFKIVLRFIVDLIQEAHKVSNEGTHADLTLNNLAFNSKIKYFLLLLIFRAQSKRNGHSWKKQHLNGEDDYIRNPKCSIKTQKIRFLAVECIHLPEVHTDTHRLTFHGGCQGESG